MPIQVTCPHCQAACGVAEQHVGKAVKCYRCSQVFTATLPEEDLFPEIDAAAPVPVPVGPVRLDIGCATSAGRVRFRNEDSFLAMHQSWANLDDRHELALLIVADGMGGHEAGDQASGLAIRSLGQSLLPHFTAGINGRFPGAEALPGILKEALQEANRAIFTRGQSEPACRGMGATGVCVFVWDDWAAVSHVGDCRLYHYHDRKLVQITEDQTLVARMVHMGKLSPAEALTHPARNEVAQALGRREIEPSSHQLSLTAGDWLLLACDGLPTHVDGPALEREFAANPPAAQILAQRLVDLANEAGGSDNCTVIAVHCT